MADTETEKEWSKSKRIDEERMKAARDIEAQKGHPENLGFLGPKADVSRGRYSKDPAVLLENVEKYANRSIILVVAGIVLNIIGMVGGLATSANHLGSGGAIISGIPSAIGYLCLGIGVIFAILSLIVIFVMKSKGQVGKTSIIWTSFASIIFAVVYVVLRVFVLKI